MATIPTKVWDYYFGPGDVEDSRIWEYVKFGDHRYNWKSFRRSIFTRPMSENGQLLLPFVRPCTVSYTNLGQCYAIHEQLINAEAEWFLSNEGIIKCYHHRGLSELTFRSFKNFGNQQLPFKKFKHNETYYHCMFLGYNLHQALKEYVCQELVPITSYPKTLRRKIIDIGAKLIKKSRELVLKLI